MRATDRPRATFGPHIIFNWPVQQFQIMSNELIVKYTYTFKLYTFYIFNFLT